MNQVYKFSLLSIFLFFYCSIFVNAQVNTFSNEFMSIGVSARAHGMSNAQVANVSDATAGYWNPAGLTGVEGPVQVSVMHAEWFAGIAKYDFLSMAKTLGNREKKSTIGLSIIRLGIDQIPNTFFLVSPDGTINYDKVFEFSAADYAFLISYARQLNDKWSIGGGPKIIRRVVGRFGKAWGFGLDVGAQYKSGNFQAGIMVRDLTTTFNAWSFNFTFDEKVILETTGNVIPVSSVEVVTPRLILGGAWSTRSDNDKLGILVEMDVDFTFDGERNTLISFDPVSIDPHVGFEADFKKFIYLRGGINNIQKALDDLNEQKEVFTLQPNLGLGIQFAKFRIDYALTNIGNVSQVLYSNVFSLTVNLNKGNRSPRYYE